VASLGGLLFGFDTAVISGAEKDIQQVYGLSDFLHGFTMSSALIGTIIGALFSTRPVEKYGRQKSLIVFPNSVRAGGQVLGSMTHWFWSALLTWTFPVFLGTGSSGGALIFGIFAVMSALSIVFAWKLPETKNKSLEQIQSELVTE
jgi:MFS family permease